MRNAQSLKLEDVELALRNLPQAFTGTRWLFLADLHMDRLPGIYDRLIEILESERWDYCILGGDYTFDHSGGNHESEDGMRRLCAWLVARSPVFGVLGNHDRYRMAPLLEGHGAEVLINDGVLLERSGERLYLAGLDDCHYYLSDDLELADSNADDVACKILISHSPERYRQAAARGYNLYLAGHTHGGQICLPGRIPVARGASVPRSMVQGRWHYGQMVGYTSRGVGCSSLPVRFFCEPEVSLLTFRRESKDQVAGSVT